MKRIVTVVGLSVAMVLSLSMIAEGQSKKKGKDPELAISKRGNLIFEDDFSGEELEWSVLSGERTRRARKRNDEFLMPECLMND